MSDIKDRELYSKQIIMEIASEIDEKKDEYLKLNYSKLMNPNIEPLKRQKDSRRKKVKKSFKKFHKMTFKSGRKKTNKKTYTPAKS